MKKHSDLILNILTYAFSSVGIIVLLAIIFFVFKNGSKLISFDLLRGDYYATASIGELKENFVLTNEFDDPNIDDALFSSKWGIAILDTTNKENQSVVKIVYVDPDSPLQNIVNIIDDTYFPLEKGQQINKIITMTDGSLLAAFPKDKAQSIIDCLDNADSIIEISLANEGGGIRGSIISTFLLIIMTLIIALPLGIGGAIYLNEYAKDNKITRLLRSMIESIAGVPSIIFGLVGVAVFIPIMNATIASDGGSLAAGSLTLSIILLPIIIRTTEETLKVIPNSYRNASYALGASKTQTIFKVVLPNAISGILSATLLSIGRIIGESAALIYVIGTVIKDNVSLNERSTSLAVHIWSIMSGENPNFELACAISIIILAFVLFLSITVKIVGKQINKFEVN